MVFFKQTGRAVAVVAVAVGALLWVRDQAPAPIQTPNPKKIAPIEQKEGGDSRVESQVDAEESSKLAEATKSFPTHEWFRLPHLNAPERETVLVNGHEIFVKGSTALGCRTRLHENFVGVACSPELSPRDLAVIRGEVSETWVEGKELGFVASLPVGGVVTAALGWDETSRVIRMTRNKEGVALGEISSAENLIVMSSDEEHPHAHFYGYELDHEIDYWVRIQRPGCEAHQGAEARGDLAAEAFGQRDTPQLAQRAVPHTIPTTAHRLGHMWGRN